MMTLNRNDQLGRTNNPWSAALKVLCAIMAITGSAWPNQAGSLRPDFDTPRQFRRAKEKEYLGES
jgi:hypothetical protein